MKIIYEDLVDFEPLELTFIVQKPRSRQRATEIADFVIDWMKRQEAAHSEVWSLCEYSANVVSTGFVKVYCEHMPSESIEPLADAVANAFPNVSELRLGIGVQGPISREQIDWIEICAGTVTIDDTEHYIDAFDINFTAVTAGQFLEFIDDTNYLPYADRIRRWPGYTVEHFRCSYGKSKKIPICGLTYDDAAAFAQWANFKLPTDQQLCKFFDAFLEMEKIREFDNYAWTCSSADEDMYYVRRLGPPQRIPLHRHHYKPLEAPSVHVVREAKGDGGSF